jgi:hypothetical protein
MPWDCEFVRIQILRAWGAAPTRLESQRGSAEAITCTTIDRDAFQALGRDGLQRKRAPISQRATVRQMQRFSALSPTLFYHDHDGIPKTSLNLAG